MAFERLEEANKPRFVIDQVLSSIQDGTLEAGARLPSEAKLAELTGVGRTSVREALAALRLMGVVETRVGNGTYVRPAEDRLAVTDSITEAIASSEEATQLLEARAAFEYGVMPLAVARWSKDKAARIIALLEEMAGCASDECYEDYIRLHRLFHLTLAQATDNPIVVETERSFLDVMDHEGWKNMERQFYLPNRGEYLKESVDEHRAIIQAISDGKGQEASELMHAHFARHRDGENG